MRGIMSRNAALMWGAAIVTGIVLTYIGMILHYALYLAPVPLDLKDNGPLIVGCIISMANLGVGYWLGSSVGSARKDDKP